MGPADSPAPPAARSGTHTDHLARQMSSRYTPPEVPPPPAGPIGSPSRGHQSDTLVQTSRYLRLQTNIHFTFLYTQACLEYRQRIKIKQTKYWVWNIAVTQWIVVTHKTYVIHKHTCKNTDILIKNTHYTWCEFLEPVIRELEVSSLFTPTLVEYLQKVPVKAFFWNLVDYGAVPLLHNVLYIHNRHPTTRPWGRSMRCLLWIQTVVFNPLLYYYMPCHIIFGRVIMAPNRNLLLPSRRPPHTNDTACIEFWTMGFWYSIYAHVHVYVYVDTCTCPYAHMHTVIPINMVMSINIHMHIYIYTYTYTHMHIHIHTHTLIKTHIPITRRSELY